MLPTTTNGGVPLFTRLHRRNVYKRPCPESCTDTSPGGTRCTVADEDSNHCSKRRQQREDTHGEEILEPV